MDHARRWMRTRTASGVGEAGRARLSKLAQVGLFVVLSCTLAVIAGCRDSDALKEIIHDQNASIIDYDDPSKFWINDSTAEEESNQVSSLEVSEEDPDSEQIQNLVVYSSDPNTEGFTAKQSIFSPYPDFTGLEASETVFFYYSDSVDALEREVTSIEEEEEQEEDPEDEPEEEEDEQTPQQTATTTTDGTGGAGTTDTGGTVPGEALPSDDGGTSGDEGPENPNDDSPTTGPTNFTDGVGDWKSPTVAFDVSNPDADIPSFESVAAYGQLAVIVQMIGGDGALAATDAETLASFSTYGVACSAVEAWTLSDGDISANPQNIDVEAIVASGADAIIVTDSQSYTYYLSDEQLQYLEDNGVQWVNVRVMNTSSYIKSNVTTVGEMLQGSSKAAYGSEASSRAAEYVSRHDAMVTAANGGLAQVVGAYNISSGIAYQASGDADGLGWSDNDATYTVLIDYWDASATYSSLSLASGLAFATVGYSATPVSYYIQAGGSINNAAAFFPSSAQGVAPVHQFGGEWSASNIQGLSLDVSITTSGELWALLDSRLNFSENTGIGWGLGSSAMPKIIVTSSSIKEAILANSALDSSAYHAYSFTGGDLITNAIGLTYAGYAGGLTTAWACIGNNGTSGVAGDPNPVYPSGVIDADDILVNPSGLFCDWTEGTVESFLESGWVAAYINGTYSASTWASEVQSFYSWAYGISVNMGEITG